MKKVRVRFLQRAHILVNEAVARAGRGQAIIPVPQTGFPYYGRVSPTIVSIALLGQMPRLPRYKNWSSMCCVRELISIVTLAQEIFPKGKIYAKNCSTSTGSSGTTRDGSLAFPLKTPSERYSPFSSTNISTARLSGLTIQYSVTPVRA